MRAEFDAEQPPVRVVQNGKTIHVFIALHGAWETHSYDEAMDQQRVWSCDYREIITEEGKIDLADVKAHPENYLNWVEPKAKTAMERRMDELEAEKRRLTAQVKALSDRNDFVEDCIAEMAAIVYA